MAKLIVQDGPGSGTAYELLDDRVTIGRDPSNTIQIPSEAVSRNHAVVSRATDDESEFWTVRDLNSKNGVLLNRKRIAEARLASGDELALGECVLRFVERDFDALGSEDVSDRGSRLVMRDTLDRETAATRPVARAPAGAEARRQLTALLDLSQIAGSARSYSELFQAIAGAVEQNLAPHRTVPILFDERKGLLRPWIGQRSEFDKHLAKTPISSTILEHVRKTREAILSEAAQDDARLRDAHSITAYRITSAMCAPIQIGERLLGAIYVDRLGDAEGFTEADLELLSAFTIQAAAAIEAVRVREAMGRERFVREKEARGEYDIVGRGPAMQAVFRFIAKAAPTDAGVLIEGGSGTGKELVARAIHLNSKRRHQPFEVANCAAMAPSLLESELFGHVKGAFTGADRDRAGRFELADGGTLFLDEIGELPESSQSKLLRVLETGELRRVGDVKDRTVNVRVVAATNKRLAEEVKKGAFREDLYFRLNVLKVSLPLLKDRGEDIVLLAEEFLRHFSGKCGRPRLAFDGRVLKLFARHDWPGNVRELKNVVERMVVMAEGETLSLDDVPFETRSGGGGDAAARGGFGPDGEPLPLRDVEKAHIERVLRHTAGNKKEAARMLGIDRSTLYAKLKQYEIE